VLLELVVLELVLVVLVVEAVVGVGVAVATSVVLLDEKLKIELKLDNPSTPGIGSESVPIA